MPLHITKPNLETNYGLQKSAASFQYAGVFNLDTFASVLKGGQIPNGLAFTISDITTNSPTNPDSALGTVAVGDSFVYIGESNNTTDSASSAKYVKIAHSGGFVPAGTRFVITPGLSSIFAANNGDGFSSATHAKKIIEFSGAGNDVENGAHATITSPSNGMIISMSVIGGSIVYSNSNWSRSPVGTVNGLNTEMNDILNMNNHVVKNVGNATEDDHALNRITADGRFVRKDADTTMGTNVDINFNSAGGKITGLPTTGLTGSDAISVTQANTDFLNKSGDSLDSAANLTFSGGGEVLGLPATPTTAGSATSKAYVDNLAYGLSWKNPVRLATTAALPANTSAGSGVGKTLTADANGALTVDSVSVAVNDRILVKNETPGSDNGIYVVTATGDGSNPYVLTRATDYDGSPTGEVKAGDAVLVTAGTVNNGAQYVNNTSGTITVDTTAMTWVQSNAATSHPDPHLLSSGSAAAPTYSFSGDSDTGAYNPSANVWGVSTGGSLRVQVDSNGLKVITGDLEIEDPTKGVILESPDNTRWRITMTNDGSIDTNVA